MKVRTLSNISALLLAIAGLPTMATAQIFVNHAASGDNDGSSWTNAHTDLQAALAAAAPGNEIWVAAGVYKPTDDASDRSATFELIDGVEIYGGFAGTETDREHRDWQANLTVLSGDIDNDDITDANGVVVDSDDIQGNNSFHVVTGSSTDATAFLDGFVITGGLANGSFAFPCGPACGGGMYNNTGNPTLANIRFSGNSASERGGGMSNWESSPTLANVTFNGNHARWGGGMFNLFSNPSLTNATFSGNRALRDGGGMSAISGNPTLTNVTFSGNRALRDGGGLYNFSGNPTLTNVTISGNHALRNGGGLYNFGSSLTLTNVSFSGNSASERGGGMINEDDSDPVIRNTIFWNNQDDSGSGTARASISNDYYSTPQISFSLVQGCNPNEAWAGSCGTDGGNNLRDADPLFVDTPDPATAPAATGNLRLSAGSPAIDAGNDDFVDGISTDLDGNPRIVGPAVDLGPYENDAYLLTLDVIGSGMINATPLPDADTGGYAHGMGVQLEAIADAGWLFLQWSDDLSGDVNPDSLTIGGNMLVTATFAEVFTVTATVMGGQGSISPETQEVVDGQAAGFTVTPEKGWSNTTVTGDTCNPEVTGGDQWQAPNITEDCAVEASFAINQYSVGGEVSGLEGEGLALDINGIETLAIGADGSFTFTTELDHDSDYTVTVTAQPTNPSQTCEIANASGRINAADVTNVAVTCATPALVLDLDVLAFGNIDAETEASGEVRLTNNGEAPVTISEITDPHEPFAVTGGSCLPVPTTLGSGEDCTIEVTYAPGSETAQHASSFDIMSDAPSSPDPVQLSGHSFSAIPVPINRSATLVLLALVLLMGGWWQTSRRSRRLRH